MNGPSWLWTYLRHVFSGALRACVVDWSDDRASPGAGCTDPGDRRLPRRRRHRELPVAGGWLLRGDDRLDEGPATAQPCLLRRDPLARRAAGPCRAAAEGREGNVQAARVRRRHLLRAEGADAAAAAVPGGSDRP